MGITKTSADIFGEVTDTGGETPNVTLFYGAADQGETTSGWDVSIELGAQDGAFSLGLTGLDSSSSYHYRLYAENSSGSAFSSAMSFTTETPQPPAVAALPATGISISQARVHGTLIGDGNQTTHLTLYYGLTDGAEDPDEWYHSMDLGSNSVGDFSILLDNLIGGMTYYYRIQDTNTYGSVWSSTAESFRTLIAPDAGGEFDPVDSKIIKAFYFGYSPKAEFAKVRFEVKPEPGSPVVIISHERRKAHGGVDVVYEYSTDLTEWNIIEEIDIIDESTSDTTESIENLNTEVFFDSDNAFFRARLVQGN